VARRELHALIAKDVDTYGGSAAFSSTSTPRSSLIAILEVTDNCKPALTRYASVVITVVATRSAPDRVGATAPATSR
jgi:hypothetical protein